MGSLLTPFKWPEGQIRTFLATVTVIVLVAVAVGATAPAVGAADPTAPGAPTQLSAVWSSGAVSLSWQPPESDGGSAVTSYEYRYHAAGEDAPASWTELAVGELMSTVDGLTDDVAYRFELRAVNLVGSGASDTIDVMPLSLREGDIRIALGSDDHEGMLQVYVGDRWGKVCDDYFGHQAVTISCQQLGYADGMGDTDGPTYYSVEDQHVNPSIPYVMDNVACSGCEDRLIDCPHFAEANCYDSEVIMISCDTTSLGAPRNVLFIPGADQGRLVWNAPRSDGGSPITRYEYRYRQLHGQYGEWLDAGRNLTATIATPADGSAQRFELRAVNAEGAGPLTGVGATTIKGLTLIDANRDLPLNGVYDGDTIHLPEFDTDRFSLRVDVPRVADVHSMKLTLTDPLLAESIRDLSLPDTGRQVWSLFGADPHRTLQEVRIGELSYVILDNYHGQKLSPGMYTLAATAYASDDWTGDALDSITVSFAVTVEAPSAPRELQAHWSADELTLSWSAPADDGKGTISAYEYRSQLDGPNSGEWTGLELAASLTLAATDGADINFEVRARNEAGTGPAASLTAPVAPAQPRNVDVSVSGGQLHLSWEAPELNGGASISGYQHRYGTALSALGAWSTAQTSLTATIVGIDVEAAYVAEVRALNSVGHGSAALGSTPVITGVTLIDADDASELQSITDGGYVIRSVYDKNGYFFDDWFGFRIDPHPRASIGSMRIVLKGPKSKTKVEIGEPYSLYGDKGPSEIYGTLLPTGQYRLTATAYTGTEPTGAPLQTLEITFKVVYNLAAEPRDLSAHREDGTLTLSWSAPVNEAVETVLRYEYRSTMSGEPFGDEWTSVGENRGASFENLDATASYDFEVRAVGASGTGPAAGLTVPALPSPPSSVMLDVDNGEATLTWDPPFSNGGSAITGYQYRFGAVGADLGDWSETQASRTVTISVSDEDQPYLAQVRALNSAGHGPAGTAGTSIIQSVQLVDTGQNSDLVALTNNAVIVRSDYDTDWYGIRVDPFPGAPVGSMRFELSGAKNRIQNENWEPFSLYGDIGHDRLYGAKLPAGEYRLTVTVFSGHDRMGDILQSIELGFIVVEALPQMPQGIVANWSNGTLSLSWLPPADADDSVIMSYEYRAAPRGQSFGDDWTGVGDQLGVDLPGVADGSATDYEVRARNAAGAGSTASFSPPQPPDAPQLLFVEPGDAVLNLIWAAPERNGGASVSGYEYRIGAVGEPPGSWTSAGSGLSTTIADLSNGTTYVVELRAVNSGGGGAATPALAKVSMTNLITGFTLLDHADQANNTLELTDGTTVALSGFSGTVLAIRANISDESMVDTVQFVLSGRQSHEKGESVTPYSLYGDNGPDDLSGGTFEIGSYQLTATVYAKTPAGAVVLATRTISFTVAASQPAQQQRVDPNTQATGAPTIGGLARVGETLTADVTGIADDDELTRAVFSYQWVRSGGGSDTNIQDATGSSYTLTESDVGKTVWVQVSFTDNAGNVETLTSDATREVAAALPTEPLNLTVTKGSQIQELAASWQTPASDGGSDITGYRVQWKEASGSWDTAGAVSEATVTGTTYTITGLIGGVEYSARVVAINSVGGGPASSEATGTPAGGVSQQNVEPENNAPTGNPVIVGTEQVGETLTADVSGIDDDDQMDNAVFAYQWVRSDGNGDTDIPGGNGSSYTLTEADEGRTIEVKVSFTDDRGHAESLTSDPTGAVEAKPNSSATGLPTISGRARVGETLTADTSGIDDDDGLDTAAFSYQWLRGDAEIAGETGETYALAAEDQGRTIKVKVSFTDDRGHQETRTSDPTGAVEAKPNTLATGAPTVSGRARVGETLTADVSGIDDDDQMDNAAFSYLWLRGDAEIAGATGKTYTLVEADEGHTIKVKVSFTDGAGHQESLTSDPTGAVEAKPNARATGLPTIGGEARVGETLTADTLGINDDDGLDNAVFAYQWLRGDAEIAGATGDTYTLVEADEGQAIKVTVFFTDEAGHAETLTSDPTGEVAAAETVPGRPQDLAGEASAPGIHLTWKAPAGSSVTQYVVYRGVLQNGSMNGQPMTRYATIDAAGEAMAYTDADVESGVEYRYRVAAVNSAGEGKKSAWINIFAGDS